MDLCILLFFCKYCLDFKAALLKFRGKFNSGAYFMLTRYKILSVKIFFN